jgi:hypothetical protein
MTSHVENAPQWVEVTCMGCHRQISLAFKGACFEEISQTALYESECDRCKLLLQLVFTSPPK